MDKIRKFLYRLTAKERMIVEHCLRDIIAGRFEKLDVQKLRGYRDIFRVRVGSVRIIFTKHDGECRILEIGRRSDTTYSDF